MKLLFPFFVATVVLAGDKNGGTTCAACGIIASWLDQYATAKGKNGEQAIRDICSFLPTELDTVCDLAVRLLADPVQEVLDNDEMTSDTMCHCLNFCFITEGYDQVCHMHPIPDYAQTDPTAKCPAWTQHSLVRQASKHIRTREWDQLLAMVKRSDVLSGYADVIDDIIYKFGTLHQPLFDRDDDGFSAKTDHPLAGGGRGYWWRGLDCDERNDDIYPGRLAKNEDRVRDSNCNGIFGLDQYGDPLETKYCSRYPAKGITVLGDSASAHFGLPARWMRPAEFDEHTFDNILLLLANEGDWPMVSWATGMSENCWSDDIFSYTPTESSIYQRYVEWNRCALNDYQNMGNNGARSTSMTKMVKGLSRKQTIDKPQIVFLSLVGNDVCNGHYPTESHMTTVETYTAKTKETLEYLDTILPKGSNVVLTGLADGRVLWDNMHDRIHPLGEYRQDMTYEGLYEYLNCLQVSPCHGWLTSDADLRDFTSERALNLSRATEDIANTESYDNFDMIYYDFDIDGFMDLWESQGGEAWHVIDPVDGFHPSQTGQALEAQIFWEQIMRDRPDIFGEENPFNELIKRAQKDAFGLNKCE